MIEKNVSLGYCCAIVGLRLDSGEAVAESLRRRKK